MNYYQVHPPIIQPFEIEGQGGCMRKRYKKKKRSCRMCKPHKMHISKRWKNKDLQQLKEFEKLKKELK